MKREPSLSIDFKSLYLGLTDIKSFVVLLSLLLSACAAEVNGPTTLELEATTEVRFTDDPITFLPKTEFDFGSIPIGVTDKK